MMKMKMNMKITVITYYAKAEHERRDEINREYAEIELNIMKYVNYNSVTFGIPKRCQAALVLILF